VSNTEDGEYVDRVDSRQVWRITIPAIEAIAARWLRGSPAGASTGLEPRPMTWPSAIAHRADGRPWFTADKGVAGFEEFAALRVVPASESGVWFIRNGTDDRLQQSVQPYEHSEVRLR
jgi:hypothetical protein